ncbi:hypothetical protein [Sporosarcina sp. E16_8]|nr:hypothetical protein [Sporosarcina sp. E16_8]
MDALKIWLETFGLVGNFAELVGGFAGFVGCFAELVGNFRVC